MCSLMKFRSYVTSFSLCSLLDKCVIYSGIEKQPVVIVFFLCDALRSVAAVSWIPYLVGYLSR